MDNYEITVDDTAARPTRPAPAPKPAPAPRPRLRAWRDRIAIIRDRVAPFWPLLRLVGFVVAVAIVVYMGVRAAGEVHPKDWTLWPLGLALVGAGTWWLGLARG